jgi:hypothetical protein
MPINSPAAILFDVDGTLSALAHDPPSKTVYDPERDGIRCRSLGVHEHWNNGTDKKYSRNLGKAHGIELFQV